MPPSNELTSMFVMARGGLAVQVEVFGNVVDVRVTTPKVLKHAHVAPDAVPPP